MGLPGKHRAVSTQNRSSWETRESWERLSFFTRKFAPLAKDLIDLLANAKQFVDPNLKILAKAAEGVAEFENKFRDKFGYGDEPVDERGENDEDDDVQEEEDAEEEEDDTKKGTKSNKKTRK